MGNLYGLQVMTKKYHYGPEYGLNRNYPSKIRIFTYGEHFMKKLSFLETIFI